MSKRDSLAADFSDALYAANRSGLKKFGTGAAIYDKRGNLLSIGWSHSAPMKMVHVQTPWSRHAEAHAIDRLDPRDREKAHTITIATISSKGNITNGCPCTACAHKISKLPIKNIYYTQRKVIAK